MLEGSGWHGGKGGGRNGKGNLCTERAALEGLSCRTSGLAVEDKDRSPLVEPQNPQDPSAAKDPSGEDPRRRFRETRACARARTRFLSPVTRQTDKITTRRGREITKDPAESASERATDPRSD